MAFSNLFKLTLARIKLKIINSVSKGKKFPFYNLKSYLLDWNRPII